MAPYLAGLGPALPTIVFLGMLWPTARLREQGINVTRRTVAKYREDMRIPSTHQRRVKA